MVPFRLRTTMFLWVAAATITTACSKPHDAVKSPAAEAEKAAPSTEAAAAEAKSPADLPAAIADAVREAFGAGEGELRYLAGEIDLDGDGESEHLVHVVGPMACGTGGCPTMVFAPAGDGFRLVSTIGLTRTPIRAARATSSGWRNLVVHVAGGGTTARDAELLFDGSAYPENPSVDGARVRAFGEGEADEVIPDFADFSEAHALG